MATAILSAYNVKKSFGSGEIKTDVLKGISIEFKQGKTYAITGVSGTGKSTLMHILAGLDKPTQGAILFNGMDLTSFSGHDFTLFLNRSMGLVFQLPYLINELSVLENVMIKDRIEGKSVEQCKKHALSLLNLVDLSEKAASFPASLSGGQQQRVAILRAIFNKPAFLLADEPTGNLDKQTAKAIVDLLLTCRDEWNMGIIVSSHDPYVAQCMDSEYHLENGVLVEKARTP